MTKHVATSIHSEDRLDSILAGVLKPGQDIVIGQAWGTPRHLIDALPRHRHRLEGSRLFLGMTLGTFPRLPGVSIDTFFPSGPLAAADGLGKYGATYRRVTLFELAEAFRTGQRAVDVVLAQGAAPRAGTYSLGVTVDFIDAAIRAASAVVLEVNADTPWTGALPDLRENCTLAAVAAPTGPICLDETADATDDGLARHLLDWIPDEATVEFGIGRWFPPLVSRLAAERRGLRVHTGLLGPWLPRLEAAGALDDSVPAVGVGAAGPQAFYDHIDGSARFALLPANVTHSPDTLVGLPNLRAVNSVFEVDILGQANSELRPGGARGGIAGLPDFARGAVANPEGLSIIVLSSVDKGRSRIVPRVACSPPSLAASEIDVIVTENGSADIRALPPRDRALAIIAVADAAFRQALIGDAKAMGII